jgi:hypothetical protein
LSDEKARKALAALRAYTEPSRHAVIRVRARVLESVPSVEPGRSLLRTLPRPPEGAAARVRARLTSMSRARMRFAPFAIGAALAVLVALLLLRREEPAPIAEPVVVWREEPPPAVVEILPEKPPVLEIRGVSVTGKLAQADAQRVLRRFERSLIACGGAAGVTVVVDAKGAPSGVSAKPRNDAFVACAERVLARAVFAAPDAQVKAGDDLRGMSMVRFSIGVRP